ncbi:MAG: uroporphyrinogen-III synthase [Acidimicrobiales bacterium]|nr:uroporphyrinogen-III synthase [Acidimicrobiales bacterium]
MLTRAADRIEPLATRLARLGAAVVEVPVLAIADPVDGGEALRAAVAGLDGFDWVVVTSANGARRLLAAGPVAGRRARVAAVGPATAAVLEAAGVTVDLVPDRAVGEALLAALPAPPPSGGRVLLARAAVAREVLPDGLRAAGWEVEVVDAYRTVAVVPTAEQLARARRADAIAFTSSSTVEHFLAAAGPAGVPPTVVCIGPITAATARRLGLSVDAVAAEHTAEGLVAALVGALGRSGPP